MHEPPGVGGRVLHLSPKTPQMSLTAEAESGNPWLRLDNLALPRDVHKFLYNDRVKVTRTNGRFFSSKA